MATRRAVPSSLVRAAANNSLVRGALQDAIRTGGSGNPGATGADLLGSVFTGARRIVEAAGFEVPAVVLPPSSRRSSSSSRPTGRTISVSSSRPPAPGVRPPGVVGSTAAPMIQAPAPQPTGGTVRGPMIASPFNVGAGLGGAAAAAAGGASTTGVILAGLAGALADGGGSEVPSGSNLVPGATGGGNCPQGTISVFGRCLDVSPGGATAGAGLVVGGGEAVHGQYGVGVAPMVRSLAVRDCPAGMVLGKDGICYNRAQLRKSEREHPPQRKPLMTGGDLNAISRAATVARKLKRKNRELKKLGLL